MGTKVYNIEIAGACCSVSIEDQFIKDAFDICTSGYMKGGFLSEGVPEISFKVTHTLPQKPEVRQQRIFYHAMEYDSVSAGMYFDTDSLNGSLGMILGNHEKMTMVRIIELIETFLCNVFIFYYFLKQNGTLIHSSGIADGERGYVFAGASGNGKSTIAKLSAPRMILCDDLVFLRKNGDGKKRIWGTPFFGDADSINRSAECKAIFFIEKSDTNKAIPINTMTASVELLKEGIIGSFLSMESLRNIISHATLFPLLLDLLDGIPCYRLKFKKENSFWEVINGLSK
jgi:hypothetical protein